MNKMGSEITKASNEFSESMTKELKKSGFDADKEGKKVDSAVQSADKAAQKQLVLLFLLLFLIFHPLNKKIKNNVSNIHILFFHILDLQNKLYYK